MEGKIVYTGKTKDGKEYVIRYPLGSDAYALLEYINTLSKEKTFVRFQGEQLSIEEETEYLSGQIKKINKNKSLDLLIECGDKIIGHSGIDLKDKTESHEGVFGISIAQDFRGEGVGKILMEAVVSEAKKYLTDLRIITLGVFGNNQLAFDMYKIFGFEEYGRLPEGSLHKGNYVDHVYMYKKIR